MIYSPLNHSSIGWGLQFTADAPQYEDEEDFVKAEYIFQEKATKIEAIGSSCVITVEKSIMTLKSKEEQLAAKAEEIIENIQKRFPYSTFVAAKVF